MPLDETLTRHQALSAADPPLRVTDAALRAVTAYQVTCAIGLIGTLRYIAPADGQDFSDLLAASLYGGDGFRTCKFLAEFLPIVGTPELHNVFAKHLVAEVVPAENAAGRFIGQSILPLGAKHLELMMCGLVADLFGDDRNSREIAAQRRQFLDDVRRLMQQ